MNKASLYTNLVYKEEKPTISVLFETNFTKEIRILFKKNQFMKEHKTPFPIVVEIVEGEIGFGVKGEVHNLKKGDLIALEGGVPHDLRANKNSIVRLTLSKNDDTKRVKNVAKI